MKEKSWVIDLPQKLRQQLDITKAQSKEWKKRTIYKLPPCITDRNEKAYKPQLVSFGPYHHGDSNVKPMESQKERAFLHFLERSGTSLQRYVKELRQVAEDMEGAYDSLEKKWKNSDEFLELMLRDGCFMLEILRALNEPIHYPSVDPSLSYYRRLFWSHNIMCDMLMLENQLPMLLLEKLLALGYPDVAERNRREYIHNLVQDLYFPHMPNKELHNCCHVLDVYRKRLIWNRSPNEVEDQDCCSTKIKNTLKCCLPEYFKNTIKKYIKIIIDKLKTWLSSTTQEEAAQEEGRIIFSARELQEAGVRIRRSSTRSLNDIHFHSIQGILSLPRITVDDDTETYFLNAIAFEGHHLDARNEVTDYICFMNDIIYNAKDVEVLRSHNIIDSFLGSNEAVVNLFTSISKDIRADYSGYLGEVGSKTNKFCKTRWHLWRASLIETYFRNPWAIISAVAGIFLFALTIIQTVYTAGQYYQK